MSAVRLPAPRWLRLFDRDHRDLGNRYVSVLLTVGAALSIGALLGIALTISDRSLWHAFVHADWPWLIIAPVGVAVSHLGYTLSYREVCRKNEGTRLTVEEAVAMVTTGFGPFSPGGGFALDAREFRRLGFCEHHARQKVRVLGLVEYAVLAPATFMAACYLYLSGAKAQTGLLPSWIIGVPVGTVVVLSLLHIYRKSGRPESWRAPIRHLLDSIEEMMKLLWSWPQGLVATAGMTLYWVADIAALSGCIVVFTGGHGSPPALIVGYATGYALTRRTLPLAGAGVVEALLPFALSWVGYPLASAILAVIAYRIFNLWLAVFPAFTGLDRLRRDRDS